MPCFFIGPRHNRARLFANMLRPIEWWLRYDSNAVGCADDRPFDALGAGYTAPIPARLMGSDEDRTWVALKKAERER